MASARSYAASYVILVVFTRVLRAGSFGLLRERRTTRRSSQWVEPPRMVSIVTVEDEASLPEPASDRTFGRRQYWDDFYRDAGDDAFSWYSGWNDLAPFVRELLPNTSWTILVPGVGNDGTVVDMYDAGYQNLTAFDYSPEAVECARHLLSGRDVELFVADARNLQHIANDSYDAALDKGTLDAIYLSGGLNKTLSFRHLDMAVSELARVVKSRGIVISICAVCAHAIEKSFGGRPDLWKQLRDGSIHITEDGFASNNVDGTMLAWRRR